eukprot:COSAG06_NODE_2404_length_6931_cov_35.420082_3_plen_604_part_00
MVPVCLAKGQRVDYLFDTDGGGTAWNVGTVRRANRRAVWVVLDFQDGDRKNVLLHAATENISWRYAQELPATVRKPEPARQQMPAAAVSPNTELESGTTTSGGGGGGGSGGSGARGRKRKAVSYAESSDSDVEEEPTEHGSDQTPSSRQQQQQHQPAYRRKKCEGCQRQVRFCNCVNHKEASPQSSDGARIAADAAAARRRSPSREDSLRAHDAETKRLEVLLQAEFRRKSAALKAERDQSRAALLASHDEGQSQAVAAAAGAVAAAAACAVPQAQQQHGPTAGKKRKLTAAQQPRYQKSAYQGVIWDGQHWRAEIMDYRGRQNTEPNHSGKPRLLGYFEEEVDAAKAFDNAVVNVGIERRDAGGRGNSGAPRKLNFPDRQRLIEASSSSSSSSSSPAAAAAAAAAAEAPTLLRGVKPMAGGSSGGGGGGKRWLAVIRGADGRVRELGRFSEQGEAGRAYDHAATALHGLKAKLNFAAVAATEPVLAGGAAGKTKRQACPGEPCRGGQPGSKRRAKSSQYHGVTWHENPFGINEDSYWIVGDKTVFLSHLHLKTIILPRQARDKHMENSKKRPFCCRDSSQSTEEVKVLPVCQRRSNTRPHAR